MVCGVSYASASILSQETDSSGGLSSAGFYFHAIASGDVGQIQIQMYVVDKTTTGQFTLADSSGVTEYDCTSLPDTYQNMGVTVNNTQQTVTANLAGTQCAVVSGTDYRINYASHSTHLTYFNSAGTFHAGTILSADSPVEYGSSRILSINPPSSITPISSPVTFSVDYYSFTDLGSSTPNLRLTLLNQDTADYSEIDLGPIDSSVGSHTLTSTSTVLKNGLYTLSAIFNNSPNVYVATSSQFIITATSFPQNSLNSYFYGSTFGTNTPSLTTNLLSFINVPQLLSTRVPFAYLFQFGSIVSAAVSSSSVASELPSSDFTIVIASGTRPTVVNVDLFSTTTITHYLPAPVVAPIRTLLAGITYFMMALFLFHDARSKKHL